MHKAVVRRRRVSVSRCASVVECGKYTWRAFFFNEVTDDFVVEVLDGRPFDLFPYVFLLLSFQCKLDENLLQLLIDIIDAQLLKGIVLRDHE